MTDVSGIFDNAPAANKAVSELLDMGFKKEDISLIVSDNARHTIFAAPTDDEDNRAVRGGAAGALFGGALGALVAGLTTVGVIAIPGSGLLFAGPIISILAGTGAGVAAGGLSGALISAGFAVDEAKRYEDEIKHGKAVIVVHTTDDKAGKARVALSQNVTNIKVA